MAHDWRHQDPVRDRMKDDRPFAFAGLWEGWKDPATEEWLRTCTIITGEPNELVAQVSHADASHSGASAPS